MKPTERGRHFAFQPDARLVRGRQGLAIHGLFEREIYWIRDARFARALCLLHSGKSLAEAATEAGVREIDLVGYASGLSKLNLGFFTERRTGVENFRPTPLRSQVQRLGQFREGGRLTVEISDRCVYDCEWCTSGAGLTSDACSCGVWSDHGEFLPIDELVSAVEILNEVGVDKLIIRGGEPFLEADRLWALLDAGTGLGMRLEVHSTGHLIDESVANRLRGKPVHLVLLAPSNREHDFEQAVGVPGSFDALVNAAAALKAARVAFSLKVPFRVADREGLDRVAAWGRELGAAVVMVFPYASGSGESVEELGAFTGASSPQSFKVGVDAFQANGETHYCFDNAYFIAADGRMMPCIGWRKELVDLNETGMEDVLREEMLQEVDDLARRHTPACGGCEFRLGCRACLVRTVERKGHAGARHWNCMYDPDTATWVTRPASGNGAERRRGEPLSAPR